MGKTGPARRSLGERFWEKVSKGDGCWIWTGCLAKKGYGKIFLGGTNGPVALAHRVAWTLENGPIPSGMFVCHRCDNPPCVRPDHLFLGDCMANLSDMRAKGRGSRGITHGNHVLSPQQVLVIRERLSSGHAHHVIALEFGVARSTISQIANRSTWAWLA